MTGSEFLTPAEATVSSEVAGIGGLRESEPRETQTRELACGANGTQVGLTCSADGASCRGLVARLSILPDFAPQTRENPRGLTVTSSAREAESKPGPPS